MLDFLATQALEALKKSGADQSWIDDKKHSFEGLERLKVLRSFSNLDQKNLTAVCEQIGVSMLDMQATLRVLQKNLTMKKSEFETLASVGKLDSVVLYEIKKNKFELYAYSDGFKGSEDFKTALGERRIWASVDTALSFVREMGYTGKVIIDTPNFVSDFTADDEEVMSVFNSNPTDYKIALVDEIKRELSKKNPNKPRAFTPDLLSKRELDEFMPEAACMTPARLAQLRLFANNRGKKMIALTKILTS